MVPLMLEDPKGVARRMRALVQPFTAPYWYDAPEGQPNQADLECAADMLDQFIDALDESLPGIYRELVPADEEIDWSTPRGISTGRSGPMFRLSVLPGGGYRLAAEHGDQHFIGDNLRFEAMAMLVRVLLNMWGNDG
ncbi:hypothetical protein [Paracoccus xiamenensis]|uniref:hypothetical protein n=1 Tax=Paracoccus xiamenensis TaxID=2714901 RepID=UPI00140991DC|nr:hypothetical protein [Paracoccus xiamenensis]NHF71533.1 hypothetical protein [Paracoccus xiamenensis]